MATRGHGKKCRIECSTRASDDKWGRKIVGRNGKKKVQREIATRIDGKWRGVVAKRTGDEEWQTEVTVGNRAKSGVNKWREGMVKRNIDEKWRREIAEKMMKRNGDE